MFCKLSFALLDFLLLKISQTYATKIRSVAAAAIAALIGRQIERVLPTNRMLPAGGSLPRTRAA
jgi:hypothetical protein